MNSPLKICICLLATLLAFVPAGENCAHAQSDNDPADALKKYDYPWYDAEKDQLKLLESKTEAFPKSVGRNKIALGKPKKANPQKPPGRTKTVGNNSWFGDMNIETLFMLILATVILLALAFLFYKFLDVESSGDEFSASKRKKLLSESIEQLPFELTEGNGDFRSLAQQAYQAGDLRRAFIFLYSHVLVTLDQNERITLRKGKTNRQYLKEVWEDPKLSSYFKSVMLPFESAFFGDHDPAPDQFERCWSGLENFHSHLGQTEGGAA